MSKMDEVIIDGVTYVELYVPFKQNSFGDPSGIWNQFDEKERDEIKRKMMAHLVEAGYFKRKDEYEKQHSIYTKDELFYGL